jgi:hypothetical protein
MIDVSASSAVPLSIRSVTASAEINLEQLTDGNPISRWESGGPQNGREWVTLDLGAAHRVNGLTLAIGSAFSDYARMLAIDVSLDGQTWTTIFEGPSAARAVGAAQRDPRIVPVTYGFAPVDAQWIRARQVGRSDRFPWTISEAAVFGPASARE